MPGVRSLFLAVLVTVFAALPANAQEMQSSISVSAHGGLINSPADFDAERASSFGSGVRFGGGLTLGLYERISIRGDLSYTTKSGTDQTGGFSDDVTLDRMYTGAGVELLLATGMSVEPYLYGGVGVVVVNRNGSDPVESYNYDVTEFTGVFGAGLRYVFPSNAFVFVDGTSWTYADHVLDDTHRDSSLSVGFGYRWGGN